MVTYQCKSFHDLTPEELYDILALRQVVFVVEQNCPYLDADGRDAVALHVMGYYEGKLAAYTRLLPRGEAYENYAAIGRVVTSPALRGKGQGRELMRESSRQLYRHFGPQPIKISAQAHLRDFYGSLGFEPTGESYLEDGIPHIGMILPQPASEANASE